jgi:putative transposase
MTRYRRNFIPGGSYFFTVNLADRRLRLPLSILNSFAALFAT